ncbi:DUF6397 family protein [Streptomyces sp. NPDC003077]|uniref:DUF6397 family protein n=1 Tax=Streptomyces sp. NPDC003077 TaxID=3154443 RepID=UPI0033AA2D4E
MTVMCEGRQTLTPGQAAVELQLRGGELELAIQLGEVRAVPFDPDEGPPPDGSRWRRRVPVGEIARLRAETGFPYILRERIRTVGTTEGAELMGIGPSRFLRLAKAGCLSPARFYVNRYGAVVWLYLATEAAEFAERHPELMRGSAPVGMRLMLDAGQDWRGRQWRSRRVTQFLTQTRDHWESAAVVAAVLPPEEVASLVPDLLERSLLRRLRPTLATLGTPTAAAREAVERLTTAAEFDEVMWYRVNLSRLVETARREAGPARGRPESGAPRGSQPPTFRNNPSWTTDTNMRPSLS